MKKKVGKTKAQLKRAREAGAGYTTKPSLNRELYREAFAQYQRWNEVKHIERINFEANLTPAQAWQRYKVLWEFVRNSVPPETELQAIQKAIDIQRYLARMRTFERRRHENSHSARKAPSTRRSSPGKK